MNKQLLAKSLRSMRTMGVLFLNHEFREIVLQSTKDYLTESNKELDDKFKHLHSSPIIYTIRRKIESALIAHECHNAVAFEQIGSESEIKLLKTILETYADYSGWSMEQVNALTNPNFSEMKLLDKVLHVTANPTQDSKYAEGLETLMVFLQPFIEFFKRAQEIEAEGADELEDILDKAVPNDNYVNVYGTIVRKENETKFRNHLKSSDELEMKYRMDKVTAAIFINEKTGLLYEIPDCVKEIAKSFNPDEDTIESLNIRMRSAYYTRNH
jgi:hypothetical protein